MNSRAQDKRVWLGGAAVATLLIVVVAWFGVVSPKLSSARNLREEANAAESQNAVLQTKINKLRQQNAQVPALTKSLQAALVALPFDTGLPAYTRQLARQAKTDRIVLVSISVGATSAVVGAAAAAGTGTAAPAAGTGSATTATIPPSAPLGIPVTLVSTGQGENQRAFLTAIQVEGPRRALVSSAQLTPISGSLSVEGSSTMTTQLTIFTAPLTAPALAQLQKLLRGDLTG